MKTDKLLEQQKQMNMKTTEENDDMDFSECMACGFETVLVEEVGLCGPCCFGEADTINGNW